MKTNKEIKRILKHLEETTNNEDYPTDKAHKTGLIDGLRITLDLRELSNNYK